MDSLAFLERVGKGKPKPIYVLHGDEDFLRRQVVLALRGWVLGGDGDFSFSSYPGDKVEWSAVRDELETLPFLGGHRLVVIDSADPFVTRYRTHLEKYVQSPSATGVLVLDVRAWPSNTRLAKLVDDASTLVCKSPSANRLPEWCSRWAAKQHGKQLPAPAAQLLVSLVGPEMGLLDQELAKLATYVGEAERIEASDVDRLVGNSRAQDIWKIFDAMAAGRAGEALAILGRLFDQGEEPLRILGAFGWQLRPLARAARLHAQGRPLGAALAEVGMPEWKARSAEQQLRHLGRRRIDRLYDWLLEVDLGLKGSSQLPARTLLERLVVRLARKNP
jgi:DNA polymerase-3 subunit delta